LAEIVWSAQAYDDLDLLMAYLKPLNPTAAERYVEGIREACLELEPLPECGRLYDDRYRVLVVRNHLIFYRFASEPTK
jgi:plasmid stabilization system protein ParE